MTETATLPATTHAISDVNELIERSLPLVRHVLAGVTAHFPRHADRDELAQAARLGLVEAAHRYDASRGVPFERWAALRIRGAILDAVRAVDFAPRALRSTMREVEAARAELESELGRTPTAAEHAQRLGMTLAELSQVEGRAHRALVVSLDSTANSVDEDGRTLVHTIVDEAQPDPLQLLEAVERSTYLRDAVETLPERLRDVVVSYFLEGEVSANIAARLGVTESRVSQMRSEALGLLRCALSRAYGDTGSVAKSARHEAFAAEVATRSSYGARVSLFPAQRSA